MKANDNPSLALLRQRLLGLYLLKYTLASLTIWAFLYGTTVLALRGALSVPRLSLVWGLASLPLALVPALLLAWRRLPAAAALRAVIDRHSRCGGLLMAGDEQPLGDWENSLQAIRVPEVSWRGGKAWMLFACGLTFLALGFLVQDGFADLARSHLDVGREVDKLAHQVDVLKEEKVLGKERAAALTAKLEQLRRDAMGKDPARTLESLDHVGEVASKAAQDAAEVATRKVEKLGRSEAMAEVMEKLAGTMEPARLTEAMNELAELTKKAASENEMLEMGLDKETMEALLKKSSLTPQQMKKLAEALKSGKVQMKQMVARLVKAQLLDARDLEKCDKAGKCDCEGLAAFLKENGCKSDLCDAVAKAGRGGTSRGPGAAKLEFGDETDAEGFKFKEEALPPAEVQALKDSQLSGLSAAAPNRGKEKPAAGASGALAEAKNGGGSASTQRVLPRHRGAVERYFDRPARPKN